MRHSRGKLKLLGGRTNWIVGIFNAYRVSIIESSYSGEYVTYYDTHRYFSIESNPLCNEYTSLRYYSLRNLNIIMLFPISEESRV